MMLLATEGYLEERARRGSKEKFLAAMAYEDVSVRLHRRQAPCYRQLNFRPSSRMV